MMNDVEVEELNELKLDVLVGCGQKGSGSVTSGLATGLALTMLHYR